MSSVTALLRVQTASVPATAADAAARADLARGQRAYGRAVTTAEDATRVAALLPRYGFARFALPPDALILARAPESDDDEPAPGRAEGRAAYAQASQRHRADIPSGELIDLSV